MKTPVTHRLAEGPVVSCWTPCFASAMTEGRFPRGPRPRRK